MIEEAKAVAQRLREGEYVNAKAAHFIDALVQENLRLAGEVANRNRRALEGDEATKALDKAHDYYEAKLSALRAEVGRLKQEQTLQAITDIGQLQEQAGPTRSQKLADAGYTRRPKGFGKEVDVEQAEPVAYMYRYKNAWGHEICGYEIPLNSEIIATIPLYTAPQGQNELLRQALEALEGVAQWVNQRPDTHPWDAWQRIGPAIDSIKQHLGEA